MELLEGVVVVVVVLNAHGQSWSLRLLLLLLLMLNGQHVSPPEREILFEIRSIHEWECVVISGHVYNEDSFFSFTGPPATNNVSVIHLNTAS